MRTQLKWSKSVTKFCFFEIQDDSNICLLAYDPHFLLLREKIKGAVAYCSHPTRVKTHVRQEVNVDDPLKKSTILS